MNLAETWKYRPQNSNPCTGVKKFKIRERETILSPAQIGDLNRTLDEMQAECLIRTSMGELVRLLMLTGCRLNEIMAPKRASVGEGRSPLPLPDSRSEERRVGTEGST